MPDKLEELPPRTVIRERDLARRWGKSVRFLQRLRGSELGPPWLRIGSTIFYRAEDILAYEAARAQRGGRE